MSLRLAQGPLMQQGSADFLASKSALGATSFWRFDTARSASGTEPDLIGVRDITTVTALAVGAAPSPSSYSSQGTTWSADQAYSSWSYMDLDQDFTIGMWVRVTSTASTYIMFAVGFNSGGSSGSYTLLIHRTDNGGGMTWQVDMDSGATDAMYGPVSSPSDRALTATTWCYVTAWRDYDSDPTVDTWGVQIDDGTPVTVTTSAMLNNGSLPEPTPHSTNTGAGHPYVGSWYANTVGLVGELMHVTVWEGKVLSSIERGDNYDLESA